MCEDLFHDIDQETRRPAQAGDPAEESDAESGAGKRIENVLGVPTPTPESVPIIPSEHCVFGLKRKIEEVKAQIAARKAHPPARLPAPVAGSLKLAVVEESEPGAKREAEIKERMARIKALMKLLGCFEPRVPHAPRRSAATAIGHVAPDN